MAKRTETASCVECGSVPGNHAMLWFASTGDLLAHLLPGGDAAPGFLHHLGDWLVTLLGHVSFRIGRLLGFVTLSSDTKSATSRRSRLLWEEAARRGLQVEQLLFFGSPTDTFRIRRNGRSYFYKSIPMPPMNGSELRMDDKVYFKRIMERAGLPVPRSRNVWNVAQARHAHTEFGTVCVKPRMGSNGRHTYPHVVDEDQLLTAFAQARKICAFASVEEHLEGNLCRATCVDGTLVGFLESYYPTVTGDGVSPIGELIGRLNADRVEGVAEIELDASLLGYIGRCGHSLDTVLPEGVRLPLTYRAGPGSGGSNREFGRALHPSFIEPIERAARTTKLPVVGFDIIIPDPHQPADGQRWGFVEANSLPWIDLHAGPHQGEPVDLAPHVWDLWERSVKR